MYFLLINYYFFYTTQIEFTVLAREQEHNMANIILFLIKQIADILYVSDEH